jgi:hypothetical protein
MGLLYRPDSFLILPTGDVTSKRTRTSEEGDAEFREAHSIVVVSWIRSPDLPFSSG